MYLAYTRPDFAYALSVVSQYMHNLRKQHMCETKVWLILILMITKQGLELMIIFQV